MRNKKALRVMTDAQKMSNSEAIKLLSKTLNQDSHRIIIDRENIRSIRLNSENNSDLVEKLMSEIEDLHVIIETLKHP